MKLILTNIILLLSCHRVLLSSSYRDNITCSQYVEDLIEGIVHDELLLNENVPKESIILIILNETEKHFIIDLTLTEKMVLAFNNIKLLPFLGKATIEKYPVYFFGKNLPLAIDSLGDFDKDLHRQILDIEYNCQDEDCIFEFSWKIALLKNYEFDRLFSIRFGLFKDISPIEDITLKHYKRETSITRDIKMKVFDSCEEAPIFRGEKEDLERIIASELDERAGCFSKKRTSIVGFIVDTKGGIGQFQIVQGSKSIRFDSLAIDIVKQLPLCYYPGVHKGKIVNCQTTITISHFPN